MSKLRIIKRIQKAGGSMHVTLPPVLTRKYGITQGDYVEVSDNGLGILIRTITHLDERVVTGRRRNK